MEHIVLERQFDEPLTPADVRRMASEMSCLDLYRVKPVRSYLMPDGKRLVCVFQAPDAEALRAVARANRVPADAVVWSSTIHMP